MEREEYLAQPRLDPQRGDIPLPNGCTLYWHMDKSVGCRVYSTDEVGGGMEIWHTSLVDPSTLLAALTQEETLHKAEQARGENK